MNLIEVKGYLQQRKLVPLQDIALHFRTDVATVRPLLAVWIAKGKVRKRMDAQPACNGCCRCDPATIEIYEWIT